MSTQVQQKQYSLQERWLVKSVYFFKQEYKMIH